MIQLTRINHSPVLLNSDLIEHVDTTPDTVISLTTGQKVRVLETAEQIVGRVIDFRRAICSGIAGCNINPRAPAAAIDDQNDD